MTTTAETRPNASLIPSYPPPQHLLRDLGIFIEIDLPTCRAGLEVVPEICTSAGSVRAGALATLVDVVAGAIAARAVAPDWLATGDMVLHLLRPVRSGSVIASARVLRKGRSTVVIESEIRASDDSQPIGLATVTFSILGARSDGQKMPTAERPPRTEFRLADSGFDDSLEAKLGAERAKDGSWRLVLSDYNVNSLGALQGGGLATLIDLAIESCGREHGAGDWVTTDFAIHFLSLGKIGPLVTRARLLRGDPEAALVRVEVVDASPEERLISVATGTCERLS